MRAKKIWCPNTRSAFQILSESKHENYKHIVIHTGTNDLRAMKGRVAPVMREVAIRATQKAQPLETQQETAETPITGEALSHQEALVLQQSPDRPPDLHHNTRATQRPLNNHRTLQLLNSTRYDIY